MSIQPFGGYERVKCITGICVGVGILFCFKSEVKFCWVFSLERNFFDYIQLTC